MNGILEPFPMSRGSVLNEILLGYLQAIDSHSWPGIDGLTVDVVLKSYCRAAAAGVVPGKNELLHRHPEWTAELDALFSEQEPLPAPSDPVASPLYFEQTD